MRKRNIYEKYIKRLLDILFSVILLILIGWLILVLVILVKIKLGSPVIFKQSRPGKDGKVFNIYKFRTMTNELDEDGNLLPDDMRLISFGKFLRSTSMDELPELWNILIGEMSFVGPRPLLTEYIPYYKEDERVRHSVRPGLTGWAQVNGRNASGWDQRLEQDIYYVNNISLVLDIKILFKTVYKVLKRSDILVGKEIKAGKLYDRRALRKSGNLRLRKFTEYDVKNKVKWINDEKNNKYLHYDLPLKEDKTLMWYKKVKNSTDRLDCIIEYDFNPVGLIGLLDIKNKRAEYYVTLGEDKYKGKKIAKKSSLLLFDYANKEFGIEEIYAYTEVDNLAAQKLFDSVGFVKSEKIDHSAVNRGNRVDRFYYQINF